ncbi:MAG: hypothetical protein Q7S80_00735 [bacterium]|nr:hypothetical protein [bacterium]
MKNGYVTVWTGFLQRNYPELWKTLFESVLPPAEGDIKQQSHYRRIILLVAAFIGARISSREMPPDNGRLWDGISSTFLGEIAVEYLPPLTSIIGRPFWRDYVDLPGYHRVTEQTLASEAERFFPGLGAEIAKVLVNQYFEDGKWPFAHHPSVVEGAIRAECDWRLK